MEVLDQVGDVFTAFTGSVERGLTKLFGSSNERRVRQMGFIREKDGTSRVVEGSLVDRINALESTWEKKSDEDLLGTAAALRARLAQGETLDDLLPEAFAAAREATRRVLGMRQYDVQIVGGVILHRGMIAEMTTGEGKTLVATAPAFLNALAGHVHVITVNDYLALRDMEWMGPVHMALGLTVGAIQSNMDPRERQKAYACDITYGTSNEFGFDYLRDNMKPRKELQVQGPLDFAIVDEIDNILIDEARTPLIISGPAHDDVTKYPTADRIARQLNKGDDFEVKEKERTTHLTESGVRRAEQLAGVESFYTAGNMEWPHLIDNALKAHHLYRRDDHYMVREGQVIIVDENTGRPMEGRQWSDGLHQAVEAKEGVKIKAETQTYATVTLQNFFKLYGKLGGMTGTAMTEADEFLKIYKLDVVAIPTNRPLRRLNEQDLVYRTAKDKWDAVAEDVLEKHETGRPVLVGTTSIEASEVVSRKLDKRGIKHAVLNAKHIEKESETIAQAGRKNAVTIATNMAGRGTDIILGGNPEYLAWERLKQKYSSRLEVPKQEWDELTDRIADEQGMKRDGREVAEAGGLHVIGTERHDSRRIDNQLRGRAGRQGDPGSSRFFVSLEDRLMRVFAGEFVQRVLDMAGMKEGEYIESRMVTRRIEGAQKKVEERHFDQRKNLLEYDEVMDEQRKRVYGFRQRILNGANCRDVILGMIDRQVDRWTEHFLRDEYRWETIAAIAGQAYGLDLDAKRIEGMTPDQLAVFLRDEARDQADEQLAETIEVNLPEDAEDEGEYNWQALSRWVNARFGLNTNDRELKKHGRDGLYEDLRERAFAAIDRSELGQVRDGKLDGEPPKDSALAAIAGCLDPEYPRRSLCHWLQNQFTLKITPEDLADAETPQQAAPVILERLHALYREKEVMFPVAVGTTRFLHGGDRQDREGLARWASGRFHTHLDPEQFQQKSRGEIETALADASRGYFVNGEVTQRIDETLDRAYGVGVAKLVDEEPDEELPVQDPQALEPLVQWVNQEFKSDIEPGQVAVLPKAEARRRLLKPYEQQFRPELAHAERSLVLEVLDTAWKDHLYYMDQLRSGIGLVGYAQKDPKTEYKREGRKAFLQMWDRIGEQVTGAIFRLEQESQAFVGNLWQITAATHAAPAETLPESTRDGSVEQNGYSENRGGEGPVQTVEPIHNDQPKVGRNDPCPCGSGKKYKKCHGA